MPTRNVVLTARHEALIEALVKSGRYQNASEAPREGLRLFEYREAEEAAKLDALRSAADAGIAAVEHGRFREFSAPDALKDYLRTIGDRGLAEPESLA